MSEKNPAFAVPATLLELRPDIFGCDSALQNQSPILRLPVDLAPQLALYWLCSSALASVSPRACELLLNECCALDADPMRLDPFKPLRNMAGRKGVRIPNLSLSEIVHHHHHAIHALSPFGSALMLKNPRLLSMLMHSDRTLESIVGGAPVIGVASRHRGSSNTVGVGRRAQNRVQMLDAFETCAFFGLTASLQILQECVARHATSPRIDQMLGERHDGAFKLLAEHYLEPIGGKGTASVLEELRSEGKKCIRSLAVALLMRAHGSFASPATQLAALDQAILADEEYACAILRKILPNADKIGPDKLACVLRSSVASGQTQTVSVLLEYGADPQRLDDNGMSCIDAAVVAGNEPMTSLLKAWEGRRMARLVLQEMSVDTRSRDAWVCP